MMSESASPVAQGTSNLLSALANLEQSISLLQENLDRHHKRIEPVLNDFPMPTDPSAEQKSDRAPYSTFVNALHSQIERIQMLSDRLNTLTYHLDV